ncbi:hypothetical protein BTM25_10300 [Actinomadura rubteroloni]|uniref:Uncharacterized protein n=1 Tax=Actinomadura rubteroloni TaxID=1926885 RepID=A0A2P4UNK7_9ACTN|nr:hypothetical protein [Actinomadura rubteroloni]POM26627.1 hypothetical protein BTM25_10300 [Actinomadura rubteroloni]
MTFGTMRRVVSALLRRPAVRRLLVVAGVLVAGWLLGGASAQAAHADEPAPGSDVVGVVTEAPVIGDAIRASQQVTATVPRPSTGLPVADVPHVDPIRNIVPAVPGVTPNRPRAERPATPRTPTTELAGRRIAHAEQAHGTAPAPRAVQVDAGDATGHAPAHARLSAKRPASPGTSIPAPDQTGQALPGTTALPLGGVGGPTTARRLGAHPRTRALPAHAPGVLPPVVRTAADEPSFAPD